MKIIVRNEQGIKRCFCQMRDIDYLCTKYTSERFRRLALGNYIFKVDELKEDDFIEVRNRAVQKIIDENSFIVDFGDVSKFDAFTLSKMIVLSSSLIPNERQRLDEEHKVLDLQDIISFNKGMLTYPIPVIFDDKVKINDGEVVFGSTTLSNHYMLRTSNKEIDLIDYFLENADSLFRQIYPGEEYEMEDYSLKKVNDDLIVCFSVKKSLFKSLKKRMIG